jgi:hypothetical protein
MKSSTLESKTVRPGLGMYSFYHSDRHPGQLAQPTVAAKPRQRGSFRRLLLALVVLLALGYGAVQVKHHATDQAATSGTSDTLKSSQKTAAAALPAASHCAGNTLDQFVVIDITERHLWACQGTKLVHDAKIITGMQNIPENATPPGTYKVYAKQQDTVLSGTASTGSWREPVSYWMPFLDNQYGTYGFHDASWRNLKEFGATDPYSTKGSHGCVQMSVADMGWLYNWAQTGATVSITL